MNTNAPDLNRPVEYKVVKVPHLSLMHTYKGKEKSILKKMGKKGWRLQDRHVTGWSKTVTLTFVRYVE